MVQNGMRYKRASLIARHDSAADASTSVATQRRRWPATLPSQPTQLLGRERELEELRAYLLDDWVRLITLTGCGGVGKTRLALQAAAECAGAFRGGVFLVDVASTGGVSDVAPAIAQTLGLEAEERATALERLAGALREREALLVLDGVERAVGIGVLLGQLLAACPDTKVLATSREALRLRWEHDYPVAPLAVPEAAGPDEAPDVAAALRSPAVALFCTRACAVRPAFALTAENVASVVSLCRLLDGLPLAIELAAARVRSLPPQVLVHHFTLPTAARPLDLLSGGLHDLPPRQRSLRDVIAAGCALLRPEEQPLFARLGVFAGGWTLDALQAICAPGLAGAADGAGAVSEGVAAPPGMQPYLHPREMQHGMGTLLQVLDSLVAHSLVYHEPGAEDPRFRMLHTVRAYALECLVDRGELEDLQRRHAAYYLSLAEQAAVQTVPAGTRAQPQQVDWWDRLEVEHDNLRAALDWALGRLGTKDANGTGGADAAESTRGAPRSALGSGPGGDLNGDRTALGVRLVLALCPFWHTRGHVAEGRRWLERLASVAPPPIAGEVRRHLERQVALPAAAATPARLLLAPPVPPVPEVVTPISEAAPAPSSAPSQASELPSRQEAHRLSQLSSRERTILRLLATGKRNREIASELYLSERTVAHHLTSIYNKLGVSSRTAAASLALRTGFA